MTDLDTEIKKILEELGSSYYFEGGEIDKEEYAEYIMRIKQIFKDWGFLQSLPPMVDNPQSSKNRIV